MSERSRNLSYLISVPHRQTDGTMAELSREMNTDPDWGGRLATWLVLSPTITARDLQDCAVATLLRSEFEQHRECGQALLLGSDFYSTEPEVPGLPPFRIFRVFDIVGNKSRRRMKSSFEQYVAILESDQERADGVVLLNRRKMTSLWHKYHVSSGKYPMMNAMLFGKPPDSSRLAVLKRASTVADPIQRVKMLVQARIPSKVFTSFVDDWSPAVVVAALQVMSPQEALNFRSFIERRGLLQHPQVKEFYLDKIKTATASAASIRGRKSVQGADEDVNKALGELEQKAVDKTAPIHGITALVIDKSGSMTGGIKFGLSLAESIGARCVDGLIIVAFDSVAREIKFDSTSVSDLRRAFSTIIAGGTTSIERGIALAHRSNPARYVIITDEDENAGDGAGYIASRLSGTEQIVVVSIGNNRQGRFSERVQAAIGPMCNVFMAPTQDYMLVDTVAGALSGVPVKPLEEQILEQELVRIIK